MMELLAKGIGYIIFYPVLIAPMRIWSAVWDRIEDKWWRHLAVWIPPLLILSMPSVVLAPIQLGLNLALVWPAAKFGPGTIKTLVTVLNIFAAGFIVSTVFLGPVHLFLMRFRNTETTHGSASWGSEKAAKKTGRLTQAGDKKSGGLMLGRVENEKRVPGRDPRYRVWNHVLTFAPTGAGKGIGCVIPNLLEYPGSVFALDVKGENFQVAGRRRRELGQAVHVLDPFGITGTETSQVNWLDWIDPKSPEAVSDSASLVDTLVVRAGRSESYWDDAEANLLQGLVLFVSTMPEPEKNLGTLREVMTWPEPELTGLLKEMGSDSKMCFGLPSRAANSFLAKADREKIRGAVGGAALKDDSVICICWLSSQHKAFLDDPRVVETLKESTMDFRGLKKSKVTVFLVLPPDKLRAYNRYTRLVLGQALKAMVRSPGQPEHNVLFLLDEFDQLGRFAPVEEGISILRGYGGCLWLLVQDLSQLAAVYPKWRSFLANSVLRRQQPLNQ